MAKFTPLYGNISGKLGANVFAHGKGGAYIRTFRPPTNANSIAQQRARAAFGTAQKTWSLLGNQVQAGWNNYAINFFVPKKNKPGTVYSGAAAVSSHLLQIRSAQSVADDAAVDLTATTPESLSGGIYTLSATAPSGKFGGEIQDSNGSLSASFELTSVAWAIAGNSPITLEFDTINSGVDVSSWASFKFKDISFNENFGLAVYASRKIATLGGTQKQVQPLLISSFGPSDVALQFTEGTPATGFGCVLHAPVSIFDSKYSFAAGDLVDITVYAVSKSGASKLIGTKSCAIS